MRTQSCFIQFASFVFDRAKTGLFLAVLFAMMIPPILAFVDPTGRWWTKGGSRVDRGQIERLIDG